MLLSLPNELLQQIAFYLGTIPSVGPPSTLLPLLLTHPTLNDSLSLDKNPSLYEQIFHATWDTDAIGRRFGADVLGDSTKAAGELRDRWELLHRLRRAAEEEVPIQERGGGLQGIAEDLMQVFMMLTENDGRNLGHLLLWANLPGMLLKFHHEIMIPMALQPGYPEDTADKALHITIAYWLDEAAYFMKQRNYTALSSRDDDNSSLEVEQFSESAAQVDEKIFVTRPFALALHKFDAYFAPWTHRNLPLPASVRLPPPTDPSIPVDPHLADLRPKKRAVKMTRFNREWSICPPILTLSASMGLMNQLDRTPCVGGLSASSSNSSTASLDFLYPYSSTPSSSAGKAFVAEPATETYLRKSLPLVNLPSTCHDLDVRRLLECGDPWKGGLDALSFRGKIEGKYHGSFSFFDFAGYREMLSGAMQVLYEGTFGQQSQEIILSERFVRVHRSVQGGTGPLINAGFPLPGSPLDPFTLCYSREEEETPEPEGSEFVKEIFVDGTGRSGWGNFKLTGRVRAWDGMISLVKEYVTQDSAGNEPITRGKWFYRGYVMQDSRFVGCWRDCFTDESFRGYEGSFHMRKQDERFVVPLLSSNSHNSYGSSASSSQRRAPQLQSSASYVCSWPEDDNQAAAADSEELCERSSSPLGPHPPPTLVTRSSAPNPSGTLSSINFSQVANHCIGPISTSSSSSSSGISVPATAPSSSSTVVGLTGDIDPTVLRDLHHSGFQEELSSGVFGGKRKRDASPGSGKGEVGGSCVEEGNGEGSVGLERVVGYLQGKVESGKKLREEGRS